MSLFIGHVKKKQFMLRALFLFGEITVTIALLKNIVGTRAELPLKIKVGLSSCPLHIFRYFDLSIVLLAFIAMEV